MLRKGNTKCGTKSQSTLAKVEANGHRLSDEERSVVGAFLQQPLQKRHTSALYAWQSLAYVLVRKATDQAYSLSSKDYSNFRHLVTAAAIAQDKGFGQVSSGSEDTARNLIFNIFSGSGVAQKMQDTLLGDVTKTLASPTYVEDHRVVT